MFQRWSSRKVAIYYVITHIWYNHMERKHPCILFWPAEKTTERGLLMWVDLKYKFSAICNLVAARFLWDSRIRLEARHPWLGRAVFSGVRWAGGTLIYHWFTGKRNIPLTDGTLSDSKIPSRRTGCIWIRDTCFQSCLQLLGPCNIWQKNHCGCSKNYFMKDTFHVFIIMRISIARWFN